MEVHLVDQWWYGEIHSSENPIYKLASKVVTASLSEMIAAVRMGAEICVTCSHTSVKLLICIASSVQMVQGGGLRICSLYIRVCLCVCVERRWIVVRRTHKARWSATITTSLGDRSHQSASPCDSDRLTSLSALLRPGFLWGFTKASDTPLPSFTSSLRNTEFTRAYLSNCYESSSSSSLPLLPPSSRVCSAFCCCCCCLLGPLCFVVTSCIEFSFCITTPCIYFNDNLWPMISVIFKENHNTVYTSI